jgi:GTP-binding protein Era
MVNVVKESVADVDCVLLLVEPIASIGPQEEALLERLKQTGAPALLVINKIDTVDKARLLEVMAVYAAAFDFDAILPISAITGEGLEELLSELDRYAVEGPHLFPEDMITDQPERQICAELVREKLLKCLDKEIPHGIAVIIDKMKTRPDNSLVDIDATIICEKESHKGIIIGKNGSMLKKIGIESRRDIESMLQMKVNLKLWVKVRPGWRDKTIYLDEYGYKS